MVVLHVDDCKIELVPVLFDASFSVDDGFASRCPSAARTMDSPMGNQADRVG